MCAYLSFDYVIRCVCGYLFCVRAYECGVFDAAAAMALFPPFFDMSYLRVFERD